MTNTPEWKNDFAERQAEMAAKRLAAFMALPPTPYDGEPVMDFDGDSLLIDEDAVYQFLLDLFLENPGAEVPLFCGSKRVELSSAPDLLEYWNDNWMFEDELERHHVPQTVWDAEAALNKAILEARVGFWESDRGVRVVLPKELIEEARREAEEKN